MRKIALILTLSALGGLAVFASGGSILAQEASFSTEAVKDVRELPKTSLDGLLKEWLGGTKEKVQSGMIKTQTGLEDAAGQALGIAQEAAQEEINRQANKAIQEARQKAEGYVGGVVAAIKTAVNNLIVKIKLFFTNLFEKSASTH